MEPTDLTVRILQEIRDDLRGVREEQRGTREELRAMRGEHLQRFELIETTLKDLAEQMVMLARGVKVALETRANVEGRLDNHEQRLKDLEKRQPH